MKSRESSAGWQKDAASIASRTKLIKRFSNALT